MAPWTRTLEAIETGGLRLWAKPTLAEMGWDTSAPVLSAYAWPFATWEDPTPVLPLEDWGEGDNQPQTTSHLFAALQIPASGWPDPDDVDAGKAYLARQQAKTEAMADAWLATEVAGLWPDMVTESGGIDTAKLSQPQALKTPWQAKANAGPGEAYLHTVPGGWRHRFTPKNTGYRDFYAVGDWTRTTFPVGSVEGAIASGLFCGEYIAAYEGMTILEQT